MKNLKEYVIKSITESQQTRKLKGMDNVTTDDIIDYVSSVINEIISDNDLNIEVIDYYVHGSRVFGNPRPDSDIDVVMYYKGDMREDSVFNILHDEEYEDQFIYDDIQIDVNGIRDQETGSLDNYIKKYKN